MTDAYWILIGWAVLLIAPLLTLSIVARFTKLHRKVKVKTHDLSALGVWGEARIFGITLHDNLPYPEATKEHELQHIRDTWLLGIVPYKVLYRKGSRFMLWAESRAFARSVMHGRPFDEAARTLWRHEFYGLRDKYSLDRVQREIRRWVDRWE